MLSILSANMQIFCNFLFTNTFFSTIFEYSTYMKMGFFGSWLLNHLIVVIFVILSIAYYTLLERKVLAYVQRRQGPSKVKMKIVLPIPIFKPLNKNFWGFLSEESFLLQDYKISYKLKQLVWFELIFFNLQPIADGLKLLFKELSSPRGVSIDLYSIAPLLGLIIALTIWGFIPFQSTWYAPELLLDLNYYYEFEKKVNGFYMYFVTEYYSQNRQIFSLLENNMNISYWEFMKFISIFSFQATSPIFPMNEIFLNTNSVNDSYMNDIHIRHLWNCWIGYEREAIMHLLPESGKIELENTLFQSLFTDSAVAIDLNLLYIFALSSFSVYSIAIAGWSSHSKFAFLGGLRSAAQMISYEVAVALTLIPVALLSNSFSLTTIVEKQHLTIWYVIPLLPFAMIFFISMLVETNRAPFDLPEAESELVAGFMTEYGSITFAMFFLAEYGNMLTASSLTSLLFFGGWYFPFDMFPPSTLWLALKVFCFAFLFIWVRGALPRLRYDQLMQFCWKILLPYLLSTFFAIYTVIFFLF